MAHVYLEHLEREGIMLTAIQLGNFKAFADTQKIPVKPLTLIFGPNSAGKSSLIHGIALAKQAIETGDLDVYRTTVGGEAIDLGGFRQYVHRRNKELSVEWALELDVSKLSGRIAELLAPVKTIVISLIFGIYSSTEEETPRVISKKQEKELLEKLGKAGIGKKELKVILDEVLRHKPSILTCEILGDDKTILRMSCRARGEYRLDRLDPDHPVLVEIFNAITAFYTTAVTLSKDDYEGFRDGIDEFLGEFTVQLDKFLPRRLLKDGKPLEKKEPLLVPISKATRKESLRDAVKNNLPTLLDELLQGLSKEIETEIKRFQYLGPLRSYPPRHIAFSQNEDINWFAGGGYAWDIVRKDYKIRKKVNAWLGDKDKLSTPYNLVVRHLLTIDDLDKEYTKVVDDIFGRIADANPEDDPYAEFYDVLDQLKYYEANISDIQELNLIDQRTNTVVSHETVQPTVSTAECRIDCITPRIQV